MACHLVGHARQGTNSTTGIDIRRNMSKLIDKIDKLRVYLSYKELRLRKWTTPIHWAYGLYCCFMIYEFGILAGWGLMAMFAGMELWNDRCEGTKQGCADWWEGFVTFIPGHGVLGILHGLTIITVTWF